MPITKRPPPSAQNPSSEKAIADFILGAPDASASATTMTAQPAPQAVEATEQISIRIPKALLDRATQMAERQGIPRASYIKRAIAMQLQQDEK